MTSPAGNVASLLNTAGIGTFGTDMFVGKDPGGSTMTISLYDTVGASPNPKYARDFPGMQITVFGPADDYVTGWAKAQEIKDYLLGITGQTIGTDIYFGFNMRGDISHVGWTVENRPIIITNWRFYIDHNSVGNRLSI